VTQRYASSISFSHTKTIDVKPIYLKYYLSVELDTGFNIQAIGNGANIVSAKKAKPGLSLIFHYLVALILWRLAVDVLCVSHKVYPIS
jgi:hypothetical protein